MPAENKSQDVEENPSEKVWGQHDGITIYCNPAANPITYWIRGGLPTTLEKAKAAASDRKKQQDAETVAELYPSPEPADEEPSDEEQSMDEGPGEDPPTPTPRRGRGR